MKARALPSSRPRETNLVEGNEATNNGRDGIALNTSAIANKIHGNTAVGNGRFDLRDFNAGCDSNDLGRQPFRHREPALHQLADPLVSAGARAVGPRR